MAAVSFKAMYVDFANQEEETAAFSFSWPTNREDKPVIVNGSDPNPLVIGINTKKLLRQGGRNPSSFVFHLDVTYKLTQVDYPVTIAGISDQTRRFHLLAIFTVSQQQQAQHSNVLSPLARVFTSVTGNSLRVKYISGREALVYRGPNKRERVHQSEQTAGITRKRNAPVHFQFNFNFNKMGPNREISAFFFEDQGQGVFRYQLCGTSRKQQLGSGYRSLLSHLTSTHPDFEETYTAAVVSDAPS
ncbi:hypothetical protein BBJ28_00001527 [Nothophytophthora sp. Chile5]|nr:hypothetical protein BBJ28_00001527 [Nothophytophthora sp. Chile5]